MCSGRRIALNPYVAIVTKRAFSFYGNVDSNVLNSPTPHSSSECRKSSVRSLKRTKAPTNLYPVGINPTDNWESSIKTTAAVKYPHAFLGTTKCMSFLERKEIIESLLGVASCEDTKKRCQVSDNLICLAPQPSGLSTFNFRVAGFARIQFSSIKPKSGDSGYDDTL